MNAKFLIYNVAQIWEAGILPTELLPLRQHLKYSRDSSLRPTQTSCGLRTQDSTTGHPANHSKRMKFKKSVAKHQKRTPPDCLRKWTATAVKLAGLGLKSLSASRFFSAACIERGASRFRRLLVAELPIFCCLCKAMITSFIIHYLGLARDYRHPNRSFPDPGLIANFRIAPHPATTRNLCVGFVNA